MKNLSIPKNFQTNLKDLRLMGGMSQKELGQMAGYGQNHVSYWECGKTFPGIEALMTLAAIFDVSLDALLYYPNFAKGRCNTVCLSCLRVARAEKIMSKQEMIGWRKIEYLLTDIMQTESVETRQYCLGVLTGFMEDLHKLVKKEIISKAI